MTDRSYLAALREGFFRTNDEIACAEADFAGHLKSLDCDGQAVREFKDRMLPTVPVNTFWLVEDSEFIAAAQIRAHIDTKMLAHYSGHIG